MTESGIQSATLVWSVPECPFTVECSTRVLDDIRLAVTDAFFSLPRGGAEIGGILLGAFADGRLAITGYAALDCEHASGPSFVLSPPDEARLAQLLSAHTDPAAGLRPVGWYHSHTRSGVELCPNDLEIYDSYFPQPWQVALVVRPDNYGPARAGFFFREEDGTVHAQRAYEEFTSLARRHGLLAQLGAEAQPPEEPPAPAPPEPPPRMASVPPAPSPVAAPNSTATRHEGSLCPNCGALSVHRSHRKGTTEHLLAVVGARMRRCHSCNVRFARLFFSNVYMDDARRALRRLALLLIMLVGAGLVILVMLWFMRKQAAIGPSDCLIEPARALTSLPV